jgi:Sulfotransferase family
LPGWAVHQQQLARLAEKQLFFIGGAPRSGTTWLQQILDCHPDVCCRGEGLFLKHLVEPLEAMVVRRRQAIEAKNTNLFRHTEGYPLPTPDDTEFLAGTAILLALHQQTGGKDYAAIGEKTPENVFFFPRLKHLFPGAKFIGIARDPRDVLTSAWHFFHKPAAGEDETAAKTIFIRSALPSLGEGTRMMMRLVERNPANCMIVTYEALRRTPSSIIGDLFRLLGVSDRQEVIDDCIAQASFAVMTGGRPIGQEARASFFRKGVVGDWESTLTAEMNEMVLHELGWMFPYFGWKA